MDQPIFDGEDVPDHLIQQEIAVEIAYYLVDLDDNFILRTFGESDRFDVGIDHSPLASPVTAHRIPAVYMASLHSIRPHDVFM